MKLSKRKQHELQSKNRTGSSTVLRLGFLLVLPILGLLLYAAACNHVTDSTNTILLGGLVVFAMMFRVLAFRYKRLLKREEKQQSSEDEIRRL